MDKKTLSFYQFIVFLGTRRGEEQSTKPSWEVRNPRTLPTEGAQMARHGRSLDSKNSGSITSIKFC